VFIVGMTAGPRTLDGIGLRRGLRVEPQGEG
jgi:hypothetical protein